MKYRFKETVEATMYEKEKGMEDGFTCGNHGRVHRDWHIHRGYKDDPVMKSYAVATCKRIENTQCGCDGCFELIPYMNIGEHSLVGLNDGDYIVQNNSGEKFVYGKKEFFEMFEPA